MQCRLNMISPPIMPINNSNQLRFFPRCAAIYYDFVAGSFFAGH